MDILEIIDKKRKGLSLTKTELEYAFIGYMNKQIEDYQMSSLLMAITINGMNFRETVDLTDLMLHSGIVLKNEIRGIRVDKHSTGGVGDKTSIIIGPILASLGLTMGKLSGRGLGHTGGTIDKLESIPGFKVESSVRDFVRFANEVGFAECAQTDEFTPLDKVIYALRSVTGTVESLPLIASSIMSKKLALNAKYILIDLKVGDGALVKTKKEAKILGDLMKRIGKAYKKSVLIEITNMNTPLGDNVGNALEVKEAIDILNGKKGDLYDLCVKLSATLYSAATNTSKIESTKLVKDAIESGKAYQKFLDFVKKQGGDIDKMTISKNKEEIKSERSGTIKEISAYKIGMLSLHLGGGREKKSDKIDYSAEKKKKKHVGDKVKRGDTLLVLYKRDKKDYKYEALDAFRIVK